MPTALRANGRASRRNGRGVTDTGGASCCCDGITPIIPGPPCALCECEIESGRCITAHSGNCDQNGFCDFIKTFRLSTSMRADTNNSSLVLQPLPPLSSSFSHSVTRSFTTRRPRNSFDCAGGARDSIVTFRPPLPPTHPETLAHQYSSVNYDLQVKGCPRPSSPFGIDPFEQTTAGRIIYNSSIPPEFGTELYSGIPGRRLIRHLVTFEGTAWIIRGRFVNRLLPFGAQVSVGCDFKIAHDMITGQSIFYMKILHFGVLEGVGTWAPAASVRKITGEAGCVPGLIFSFSATWDLVDPAGTFTRGSASGTIIGAITSLRGCSDESPSPGCTTCGGIQEGVLL